MYILMKHQKVEGTRQRSTARRIGLFRTRKGAEKIKARLEEQEKRKAIPVCFTVEHECYYSTRVFWEAVANWYYDRQEKKYRKLCAKRDRLERRIRDMREVSAR